MGVDLSLLPNDSDAPDQVPYSHTVLNCGRKSDLFDEITRIEEEFGEDVPAKFTSYACRNSEEYEEVHYGVTTVTPYGDKLRWVSAKHLKVFGKHPDVQNDWRNKAVWAYLENYPGDRKVALMWS